MPTDRFRRLPKACQIVGDLLVGPVAPHLRFLWFFLLAAGTGLSGLSASAREFDNVFSLNFDVDGNILHLDAPAILFHKRDQSELILDHAEFARVYSEIGKTQYRDYEVRYPENAVGPGHFPRRHSFYFTDHAEENHFFNQLQEVRLKRGSQMFGSQYARYYHALLHAQTRDWVHLVTARGTSPEYLQQGQHYLFRVKMLPWAQDVSALIPVTFRQGPTGSLRASHGKVVELMQILDEIQAHPLTAKTQPIWNESGDRQRMHYFEYSDDTPEILNAVLQQLTAKKRKGAWPNVKIRLVYTGAQNPNWLVRDIVLRSRGNARPVFVNEAQEIDQLLDFRLAVSNQEFCAQLLQNSLLEHP